MKIAIIHYWLVSMRGGEKVLEVLLDMFPEADLYTHVYNSKGMSERINSRRIMCSKINRLPFAKKLYRLYMPLMPKALMELDLQQYDLVISSESGPAKGIVCNPDAYHICYCHSPMRYLWDMYHEYFRKTNPLVRLFMKQLIPGLRLWDVISSNMVDFFIANSAYVAKRIQHCYNRNAAIVHPPADIERFLSLERRPNDFYLFFGQLTGYKRADLAIDACIASGRTLVVAGAGMKKADIRKYSKTGLVSFRSNISAGELNNLYACARALIFPGIEDFGIVPVEAQAAGCPVIAFRKGGAVETIKDGATGIFFDEQTPGSLITAMDHFEQIEVQFRNREVFNDHVQQFSKTVFIEQIQRILDERKRI